MASLSILSFSSCFSSGKGTLAASNLMHNSGYTFIIKNCTKPVAQKATIKKYFLVAMYMITASSSYGN